MSSSMNTQGTKTETSSDSFSPLKKRMRPNLDNDTQMVATAKTSVVFPSSSCTSITPWSVNNLADSAPIPKYKGVATQRNGHWGAQLYTNRRRIWLGTFKSLAEAARAYDSASIKIHGFHAASHRNFPWDQSTVHEPEFQQYYTTEAVLNMIRDGSYPQKFRDFLIIRLPSQNVLGSEQSGEDQERNKCLSCRHLFEKELTASDVGKLNRLLIPKKFAVKYFPYISQDRIEREEGEIGGDMEEVVFYDRAMRQWKFRYCYWTSSKSFVFSRGWSSFVQEKKLKEKDVIAFYTCESFDVDGQSNNYLMIDVHHCLNDSVVTEEVNKLVHESSDPVIDIKTGHVISSKVEEEEEEEETKSEKNKRGFMLFGAWIQ